MKSSLWRCPANPILGFALCFCLTAPVLAAATTTAEPLALTVAGGVSVGNYQAGVTWALIHSLKRLNELKAESGQGPEQERPVRFASYQPRTLEVFTGASAGNINAVLGSFEWCAQDSDRSPEDSLLYKVWIRTGIEELLPTQYRDKAIAPSLPEGVEPAAAPGQQPLLTRDLFNAELKPSDSTTPAGKYLTHYELIDGFLRTASLDSSPYNGCHVEVGTTMTDRSPSFQQIGRMRPTRSSAVSSFYTIHGDAGHIAVSSPALKAAAEDPRQKAMLQAMGRLFFLNDPDAAADQPLQLRQIFWLSFASSAFPEAFAPVSLNGWSSRFDDREALHFLQQTRSFEDGGVFNDYPVPLALQLHRLYTAADDPRLNRLRTIFVDDLMPREGDYDARHANATVAGDQLPCIPLRRYPNADLLDAGVSCFSSQPQEKTATDTGLVDNLKEMLERWAPVARERDLDVLVRTADEPNKRNVGTTSRYADIAGESLLAFGAFLGRPLREHDFYVGIYDGLGEIARNELCGIVDPPGQQVVRIPANPDDAACIERNIRWLAGPQGLRLSGLAQAYVSSLSHAEFDAGLRQPNNAMSFATQQLKAVLTERDDPDQAVHARVSLVGSTLLFYLKTYHHGNADFSDFEKEVPGLRCEGGGYLGQAGCSSGLIQLLRYIYNDNGAFEVKDTLAAYKASIPKGQRSPWILLHQKESYCPKGWGLDPAPPLPPQSPPPAQRSADTCLMDGSFWALLKNPELSFKHLGEYLQDRMPNTESSVALSELMEYSAFGSSKEADLAPTSAPLQLSLARREWWQGALKLLPYTIAADGSNGGINILYRPTYFLGDHVQGAIILPVLAYASASPSEGDKWVHYGGVGTGYLFRPHNVLFEGVETYGQYWRSYNGAGDAWDAELAVLFATGKLRLAVRYSRSLDPAWTGPEGFGLTIGVSDFPAFIYWGSKYLLVH